ncbi:MAG: hypothetical protein KAS32_20345 [Candidatus Peribacteraceae bacterium]|nr:hypothetical protein [Candidatus Peribacteraceae bacterium]
MPEPNITWCFWCKRYDCGKDHPHRNLSISVGTEDGCGYDSEGLMSVPATPYEFKQASIKDEGVK